MVVVAHWLIGMDEKNIWRPFVEKEENKKATILMAF